MRAPGMEETDRVWLDDIVELRDGYESEAVQRFAQRLIGLAKSRLPEQLRRRVDPEDIVQSVFRTFFARHNEGQFAFRETADVWRLLAAITYRKTQRTIRFHHQQRRGVQHETPETDGIAPTADVSPTASSLAMMMELLDKILAELPLHHQEILRLRLEEYSIHEIAEKVGVSSRTVNRALTRVRQVATEITHEDDS